MNQNLKELALNGIVVDDQNSRGHEASRAGWPRRLGEKRREKPVHKSKSEAIRPVAAHAGRSG
ncbi:hypothetical protein MPC1_2320002 [Methylocella tundrae]|uniref:Uncharacterized protein n=1 Tax=Methylocella tundrae TaxID=227605 RepID=A0A4U8Z3C7_METTU|nr:protein of unknown function [Methylocella tundrae]VTZ25423.1 hypothetical protein MPC1_2320002 [Methylocella tundrae]